MSLELWIYISGLCDSVCTMASLLWLGSIVCIGVLAFLFVMEDQHRELFCALFKKILLVLTCLSVICAVTPSKDTINKIIAIKIAKETPLIKIAIKTMNWLEVKANNVIAEKK